jgi:hypothetical protein
MVQVLTFDDESLRCLYRIVVSICVDVLSLRGQGSMMAQREILLSDSSKKDFQ